MTFFKGEIIHDNSETVLDVNQITLYFKPKFFELVKRTATKSQI